MQVDRSSADDGTDPGDQGFAWHYLRNVARRDLVVLSDRQGERVNPFALSPDGRTLATGDEDGTIRLRDPETGRVRMTLRGHQLPVQLLAFSPDGRRLVSRGTRTVPAPRRDEVFLWDLLSPRPPGPRWKGSRTVTSTTSCLASGAATCSRSLGSTEMRMQFGFWDVATDPVHPRLEWRRPTFLAQVPITGDRTIVALEEPGRRFVVQDLVDGEGPGADRANRPRLRFRSPVARWPATGCGSRLDKYDLPLGRRGRPGESTLRRSTCEPLSSFAFSPDSRYLALDRANGEIEIRDLVTNAVRTVTPPVSEPHPLTFFAFSPDSRYLATNVLPALGKTQPTTIWQLDPWRLVATYPGELKSTGLFLFTPDGRSLILKIGESAVRWNFLPRSEPEQPTGHADEAWSLAFSPDGSILASGSDDTDEPETIKLWDVATGRLVRGWYAGVGTVAALAFDPGVRSSPRRTWTSRERSASGTPRPASAWRPCPATPTSCARSPSTRTEPSWPAPAPTGPSGCGTSRPAGASGS